MSAHIKINTAYDKDSFEIDARDDSWRIGRVVGAVFPRYTRIVTAYVAKEHRRKKLGTKLYEAAARLSCQRYGRPLGSDTIRSVMAESFWRKQLQKGRARCVGRAGDLFDNDSNRTIAGIWRCGHYVLKCPAPASLARAPGRGRR